jgi:hypothetical protein
MCLPCAVSPLSRRFDSARAYADFQMHSVFFEGLGMLVKRNLIDINLVEDLFSQRIIWYWELIRDLAHYARTSQNDPTQYDSLEYLYNVMKQHQQVTVNT